MGKDQLRPLVLLSGDDLEAKIRFKVERQRKLCESWAQHCRNTVAHEIFHQRSQSFKTKFRESTGGKPTRKLIVATGKT